jgi:hypothetical protein
MLSPQEQSRNSRPRLCEPLSFANQPSALHAAAAALTLRATPMIVALAGLMVLVSAYATFAQGGGPVLGVNQIWTGDRVVVAVEEIALRAAPILWFSTDEPLFINGLTGPSVLPCDPDHTASRVVYYRRVPTAGVPNADTLWDVPRQREALRIQYFFYYKQDYGGGCHTHDLETVTMDFGIRPLTVESSDGLEQLRYAVTLLRVVSDAHGNSDYTNHLQIADRAIIDVALPVTLLVEEGKHATAPDRNADGVFTPGYDVNKGVNDAWGVRDSFGSGFVGGSAYASAMTKPRAWHMRIRAATPRAEELWCCSYRWQLDPPAQSGQPTATTAIPSETYELRPMPRLCFEYRDDPEPSPGCKARAVSEFIQEKGPPVYTPVPWSKKGARILWNTIIGIRPQVDLRGTDAVGVGLKHWARIGESGLLGGVVTYGEGVDFRRNEDGSVGQSWMALLGYSPSATRRFDWHARGGLSLSRLSLRGLDLIGQIGVQIRYHPKFLLGVGLTADFQHKLRFSIETGIARVARPVGWRR